MSKNVRRFAVTVILGVFLGVSIEQTRERKGGSRRETADEHRLDGAADNGRAEQAAFESAEDQQCESE